MYPVQDDGPAITKDGIISNQFVKKYGNGKSLIAGYNDHMLRCLELLRKKKYSFPGWDLEFEEVDFVHSGTKPIHHLERGTTYGMSLEPKAIVTQETGERSTVKIDMGIFPIMLNSDYDFSATDPEELKIHGGDPDHPGTDFITDGRRTVFVRPENVRSNIVVSYSEASEGKPLELISSINTESSNGKTSRITMYINSSDNIIRFANFRDFAERKKTAKNLNVVTIFRLFGFPDHVPDIATKSEGEPENLISVEEFILGFTRPEWREKIRMVLAPTMQDHYNTDDDTLLQNIKAVAKEKGTAIKLKIYRYNVAEGLYSHIPPDDLVAKLALLAHQLVRLLETHLGLRSLDDRNNFNVKRFKNVGLAMFYLFARYLEERTSALLKFDPRQQSTEELNRIFSENNMTVHFSASFKKNWGLKTAKGIKKSNYTETLKHEEFLQLIFHVNKIVRSRDAHAKGYASRRVDGSQMGYEDPSETPESENAGHNNTAASLEFDSRPNDDKMLLELLEMTLVGKRERPLLRRGSYVKTNVYDTHILSNGVMIGVCQGDRSYKLLYQSRLNKISVPEDCCIVYNPQDNYLEINTDAGRPTQLLYVVNKETGKLLVDEKGLTDELDAQVLMEEGCIAYVDSREKEYAYVAQSRKHIDDLHEDIKVLEKKIKRVKDAITNFKPSKYVRGFYDSDQIISKVSKEEEVATLRKSYMEITEDLTKKYKRLVKKLEKLNKDPDIDSFQDQFLAIDGEILRLRQKLVFYDVNKLGNDDKATDYLSKEDLQGAEERLLLQLERLKKYIHFDYCEIDESTIFGVTTNTLSFVHKIFGARQVFGAKMVKQAEGNNDISSRWHFVPTKYLVFPCRPICKTQSESIIGLNRHPIGIPVIWAQLVRGGWGIEDSLVSNRGFLERNGFLSVNNQIISEPYESSGDEIMRDGSVVSVEFTNNIPQNIRDNHAPHIYDKLDERGIIKPGSVVREGDCLIGCYRRIKRELNIEYRDASIYANRTKVGTVTKILVNQVGKRMITIELQETRVPKLGDKFSSMQAQKGVFGLIEEDWKLPYFIPEDGETDSMLAGIIPDIFMDPPAQPSRMTVGMLRDEAYKSEAAILAGESPDATAFREEPIDHFAQIMREYGMDDQGLKRMINGKTGEELLVRVYSGVVQYLRLVHEAIDKIQNRYVGSYMPRTHQPITGRPKGGGQRMGEMEIEAIVTYGCAYQAKEYLSQMSDLNIIYTCGRCNTQIYRNKANIYYCPICQRPADLHFAPATYVEEMRKNYVAGAGLKTTYYLEEDTK